MPNTDDTPPVPDLERVRSLLTATPCVMTSAFEDVRAGIRVRSVQSCADEPPLVAVAVRRGHAIDPLIRDSHAFALLILDPADRLVARKFPEPGDSALPQNGEPEPSEEERAISDVFNALPVRTLRTGSPVITRGLGALDCEVVRHFDIEAETELYIGQIIATWVPPAR